jgi:hypothetical protein
MVDPLPPGVAGSAPWTSHATSSQLAGGASGSAEQSITLSFVALYFGWLDVLRH